MHCTEPQTILAPGPTRAGAGPTPTGGPRQRRVTLGLATLAALLCVGCSNGPPPPVSPAGPATPAAAGPGAAAPSGAMPSPTPAGRIDPAARLPGLAPPGRAARSWDDYRLQAARRIVAANPQGSFDGPVPEPLLAIPVLEIELNADGSVRRILVLRRPRQALDTVQLAIDAVHRAAPFAPVGNLPRPWKFAEVFLFDEQRRFKPRTLDL